jgi:hypothetical protein
MATTYPSLASKAEFSMVSPEFRSARDWGEVPRRRRGPGPAPPGQRGGPRSPSGRCHPAKGAGARGPIPSRGGERLPKIPAAVRKGVERGITNGSQHKEKKEASSRITALLAVSEIPEPRPPLLYLPKSRPKRNRATRSFHAIGPTVVYRANFRPYRFARFSDSFFEDGRGGCPPRSCCDSRRTR